MDIEKLKKTKILVRFIVPSILPNNGLVRLQYYTSAADEPEKFYFGLSFRDAWERNHLEKMVANGVLIKLPEEILLEFENDLFLDKDGNIIKALGYDPMGGKEKRVVFNPNQNPPL